MMLTSIANLGCLSMLSMQLICIHLDFCNVALELAKINSLFKPVKSNSISNDYNGIYSKNEMCSELTVHQFRQESGVQPLGE